MNEQQGVRGGSHGWLTISMHTYMPLSRLGLFPNFLSFNPHLHSAYLIFIIRLHLLGSRDP